MDYDKAWKYDRGHWELIDHLMLDYEDRESRHGLEDMFYLAGYNANSSLTLGRWGLPFYVDVHLPYPLVEFIPIYVVDFPSLLMLLHQVGAIVGQSEVLYEEFMPVGD